MRERGTRLARCRVRVKAVRDLNVNDIPSLVSLAVA